MTISPGSSDSKMAITERLLEIWKEALTATAISPNDNFLDLSGDSLAAMLCMSRVRKEFGVELELNDFFIEPASIATHSELIATLMGVDPSPDS